MLQGEHSAILWTFIKLPFVIMIFVLSNFEWLFYTGITVHNCCRWELSVLHVNLLGLHQQTMFQNIY